MSADCAQAIAKNLVGVGDFYMPPPQLLVDQRIFRLGDEIQITSQRLERAERLP
jgi:hypothetical protein